MREHKMRECNLPACLRLYSGRCGPWVLLIRRKGPQRYFFYCSMAEHSLEYYVARATDPFVSEEERHKAAEALCEKVNFEIEGAQLAVTQLGHKILSPNQHECLNALKAVDLLVRKCGTKVHTRVGRYRFLNQMVRLITPKYMGLQTSDEVKNQVVVMLYTWRQSMGQIEKFKEVYDILRHNGIISQDPQIDEEAILSIPPPPPRLAVFEDEAKATLLKKLLQSKKPDDLQAANRLIKSLVKNEDQKLEKKHKRAEDLEQTMRICQEFEFALRLESSETKVYRRQLEQLRPILFKYASEAAETTDESLADILRINDNVNRLMQAYDHSMSTSSSINSNCVLASSHVSNAPVPPSLIDVPCEAVVDAANHLMGTPQDVPFIGFGSTTNTPSLSRKEHDPQMSSAFGNFDDMASLEDIFGQSALKTNSHFIKPKPTLNELSRTNIAPIDFDALDCTASSSNFYENNPDALSSPIRALPESIFFAPEQIQLSAAQPKSLLDHKNIKLILHFSQNSPPGTVGVRCALLTIINFNTFTLQHVSLKVQAQSMTVSSRLLWHDSAIPAFSASGSVPKSSGILLILPLDEHVKDCEFMYTLSFHHLFEETVTSTFSFPL